MQSDQIIKPTVMNMTWDPKLVYDLALGIDGMKNLCLRHNTTENEILRLFSNKIFSTEVANLRKELQADGVSIKLKARTQFEGYLKNLDSIIHDLDTPASTKVSAIQYIGKVGDVEPKKTNEDEKDMMQGVSITINI